MAKGVHKGEQPGRPSNGLFSDKEDTRLHDPKFLLAVGKVLYDLGLPQTLETFRKYDKKYGSPTPINWLACADFIDGKEKEPKGYDPDVIFAQMEWIRKWNELIDQMRK